MEKDKLEKDCKIMKQLKEQGHTKDLLKLLRDEYADRYRNI